VSASGTSLLVLLAQRVAPQRRGAAATLVWIMMIAGFALTAGISGKLLDPYSPERLVAISSSVSVLAIGLTLLALRGLECAPGERWQAPVREPVAFRTAIRQVWGEPVARRFTVFVFLSMLAYSAQDLILEPFAGTVFGFSPGASTQLSGIQHGGVLVGMLLAATARQPGALRAWTLGGCIASALSLFALAGAGLTGKGPLTALVFTMGVANGAFSIGAIGSMMRLAGEGRPARDGVRMGMWGAAQAIAFAVGGLVGTGASDLARWLIASPGSAYGVVFAMEGVLFLVSAAVAWHIPEPRVEVTQAPQWAAAAAGAGR
jgi:MFS transporter, BCD family, chlorophyll transporter